MSCVITLMCNTAQIKRVTRTVHQIRTKGNYSGDIVLFFNNDLLVQEPIKLDFLEKQYNLILKEFPKIDTTIIENTINNSKIRWNYPVLDKIFTFHKFNLFDTYFKAWDKVLYIDAGMHIYHDIDRILSLDCSDSLLAHSNCYPNSYNKTDLLILFDLNNEKEIVNKLKTEFNINTINNFQSGLLLFDTSIIKENTKKILIDLMNTYPIGYGDQAYLNLYFICMYNNWKVLPIKDDIGFLYDYMERDNYLFSDYVMLKYPLTDPNPIPIY